MKTRPWIFSAAFALAALGCAAEEGDDVVLENEHQEGKADSVSGKRLTVTITDTILVTGGAGGCGRSGDDPWICGADTGWGEVELFVTDDWVGARGDRMMPLERESFYVFEARNEGFGLPNWRFISYGQLIYARSAGESDWTLLRCPGVNYFSDRVAVDLSSRTIDDDGDDAPSYDLAACGAPDGAIEVSTFAFPISRWFGLEDTYNYDLEVNKTE